MRFTPTAHTRTCAPVIGNDGHSPLRIVLMMEPELFHYCRFSRIISTCSRRGDDAEIIDFSITIDDKYQLFIEKC